LSRFCDEVSLRTFDVPSFCYPWQSWKNLSDEAAKAYHAGRYEQALQLTHESIKKAEQEFGSSHINYFTSVGDLATILKKKGQYKEAQKIEQENLQGIRRCCDWCWSMTRSAAARAYQFNLIKTTNIFLISI